MRKEDLKILILIGIPGSGKSTWAKEFIRKNPTYVRVNRDDFRLMLKNQQICEPKIEDLVTTLVNTTIHKCLGKKLNVIIDNTNVKMMYIDQFIEEFKCFADISFMNFDISLEKAIERDKNREATVGEEVIKRMYKDYKDLMDSFNFQNVKKEYHKIILPNFDSELPQCVVFDIDGTLSIPKNRSPYDVASCFKDVPSDIVIEQLNYHRSLGRKILILSGREDTFLDVTQEWLEFYGIKYDQIYLRRSDDMRKDAIVKKEIYDTFIKGRYNLLCVYDDRLQVLDMWYKEGVFTFNVNQGNLEY